MRSAIIHRKTSSFPQAVRPTSIENASTKDSWTALPLPTTPTSPQRSCLNQPFDHETQRALHNRLQFRSPSPEESLAEELSRGSLSWIRNVTGRMHSILRSPLLCRYAAIIEYPLRLYIWCFLYNLQILTLILTCIIMALSFSVYWCRSQYFLAKVVFGALDDFVGMWDFTFPFSISEVTPNSSARFSTPANRRIPQPLVYLISHLYGLSKLDWRQWLVSPRIMTDFAVWLSRNPINSPLTPTELSWWIRRPAADCHSLALLIVDTIDLETLRQTILHRLVHKEPKFRSVIIESPHYHWRVLPIRDNDSRFSRTFDAASVPSSCSPASDTPYTASRCCSNPSTPFSSRCSQICLSPTNSATPSVASSDTPWDTFDISWHVLEKYVACSDDTVSIGPHSLQIPIAIFEELSNWDAEPFRRDEPLWRALLIRPVSTDATRDVQTGECYIAVKVHQVISDGASLIQMLSQDLTDATDEDGHLIPTRTGELFLTSLTASVCHLWKASHIIYEWCILHPRALSVLQVGRQSPAHIRIVDKDQATYQHQSLLLPPLTLSRCAIRAVCRRLQILTKHPFGVDDVFLLCLLQVLSDLRLGRACDILQKLAHDEEWLETGVSSPLIQDMHRELMRMTYGTSLGKGSPDETAENSQSVLISAFPSYSRGRTYPNSATRIVSCEVPAPIALPLTWKTVLCADQCQTVSTISCPRSCLSHTYHSHAPSAKAAWSISHMMKVKRKVDEANENDLWVTFGATIQFICATLPKWVAQRILQRIASRTAVLISSVPASESAVQVAGRHVYNILLWSPLQGSVSSSFSCVSYQGFLDISITLSEAELSRFAPHLALLPFGHRLQLVQQLLSEHLKEKLLQLDSLTHTLLNGEAVNNRKTNQSPGLQVDSSSVANFKRHMRPKSKA